MMRILVLDTAKKTGWAMIVGDEIVDYGLKRFEHGVTGTGELQRHPQILSNCCNGIIALVDAYRPDFIVIEKPNLRGGSSFLTVGLFAVVQLITATHGIGFYSVHASTWQSKIIPGKKAVDGDTKARSMRHALAKGYSPETDDVADALCIAEYVLGGYLNLTAGVADSVPTDEANDDATSAVGMGARA